MQMFEEGEFVVYGSTGVCKIDEIKPMKNPATGVQSMYYVMHPVQDKSGMVCLPTNNTKVIIRRVMTRDEANQLIDDMPQIDELEVREERKREVRYKEALRTCDSRAWVSILKTLYGRKNERIAAGKKVTALDERYLRAAEHELYGELSVSLGMPREELEDYISGRMEQLAMAQ